ncbi:MAG: Hsp33 family molecular chaperone HslO [Clostridia bacterium]|nr:Hsp33 family molecular chaperone HslO [Clostridia bacterium]
MQNVVRTLLFDEQVSLTVADTTEMIKEGARRHGLSETSTIVFGRALSVATYMSACLKENTGEISLSVKSDGCGEIVVSGNRALHLRGYIALTNAEGKGEAAVNACFGTDGSLTVIRDDGYNRPFVGACAFPKNGGIDETFEEYYRISEQLPTRIKTIALTNEHGECVFGGVAVLQPLPFADEETLEKVKTIDLSTLLLSAREQGVEKAVKDRFDVSSEVWETREANYQCNCSREYLEQVLTSVGEEQMRTIIREDGALKVHCHYCNTDYEFTDEDADKIFKKA